MSVAEFWDLCPADLVLIDRAWRRRIDAQRDLAQLTAWAGEWIERTYQKSGLPAFDQVLDEISGKKREVRGERPSAAELRMKFQVLRALLGAL